MVSRKQIIKEIVAEVFKPCVIFEKLRFKILETFKGRKIVYVWFKKRCIFNMHCVNFLIHPSQSSRRSAAAGSTPANQ